MTQTYKYFKAEWIDDDGYDVSFGVYVHQDGKLELELAGNYHAIELCKTDDLLQVRRAVNAAIDELATKATEDVFKQNDGGSPDGM